MDLEERHGDGREEVRQLHECSVWRGLLVDERTVDAVFPLERPGQWRCTLQRQKVLPLSKLMYRSCGGQINLPAHRGYWISTSSSNQTRAKQSRVNHPNPFKL